MELILLDVEQNEKLAPQLFERVFSHHLDKGIFPVTVAVKERKIFVGFLSGYPTSRDEFHIQYAGLLPGYRGRGLAKQLFWDTLVLLGYKCYTTITHNQNHDVIFTLLKSGFRIVGTCQDTGGNLLIEWLKEMRK